MAVPVKAYIQPTAATNARYFTFLPADFVAVLCPTGHAGPQPSLHMAYDPFLVKFAFASGYNAAPPALGVTQPQPNYLKGPRLTASYMVANTFPAAYNVTQLRPSFGQLWPRSGAIPY